MVLQTEHLSKSYGGRTLFHDVTFRLEEYDRLALVGPNGAGGGGVGHAAPRRRTVCRPIRQADAAGSSGGVRICTACVANSTQRMQRRPSGARTM